MEGLNPKFAYAVVWKKEARKIYSVSSYRTLILGECLLDDDGKEVNPMCIFETLKLAKEYIRGNKDWEIIKIKLTKV